MKVILNFPNFDGKDTSSIILIEWIEERIKMQSKEDFMRYVKDIEVIKDGDQ